MQQYLDLLNYVMDTGEDHQDRTGVGTRSVFGYQFKHDMRTGFPLLTTKKLPLRWIAEELFWFLRGSTNEHELEAVGVDIWKEWATEEQCAKFGRPPGDLGPVYGHLWRNFGKPYKPDMGNYHLPGIDQIARLMTEVEQNSNSRRLIVSGWDPRECHNVALPPCHTLWQIKIHPEMYMSLHLYARSIDSFLGLPFNIASYGLLLSMIAAVTGYEPKHLVISFGDLHVYKNHIYQASVQTQRTPRALPWLSIPLQFVEGDTALARLLNIKWEHIRLEGYNPHPPIKAEVAI